MGKGGFKESSRGVGENITNLGFHRRMDLHLQSISPWTKNNFTAHIQSILDIATVHYSDFLIITTNRKILIEMFKSRGV